MTARGGRSGTVDDGPGAVRPSVLDQIVVALVDYGSVVVGNGRGLLLQRDPPLLLGQSRFERDQGIHAAAAARAAEVESQAEAGLSATRRAPSARGARTP